MPGKFSAAAPSVPEHVPYLIIGAGTASVAAFRAIKAKDAKAKVSSEMYLKFYFRSIRVL